MTWLNRSGRTLAIYLYRTREKCKDILSGVFLAPKLSGHSYFSFLSRFVGNLTDRGRSTATQNLCLYPLEWPSPTTYHLTYFIKRFFVVIDTQQVQLSQRLPDCRMLICRRVHIHVQRLAPELSHVHELQGCMGAWVHRLQNRIDKYSIQPAIYSHPRTMAEHVDLPDFSNLDMTGKIQITNQHMDHGGYSDISRGTLTDGGDETVVAVKTLRVRRMTDSTCAKERLRKRLYREVVVWRALRHPNVAPLLGFTNPLEGPPALISPWYSNGNVIQYLKLHPEANRMNLLYDLGCGLEYLHSLPVAHGDIKGENALIDAKGRASWCDFGMSKFIGDVIRVTGFTTTNAYIGGTARFLSPELLQDAPKTTMTDIWAFGCLISQIVTDLQPYSHIKSDYAVFPEILRCGPPITAEDREAHSPGRTDFWVTVTKCWSQEADARPTAADLLREIAGLLSSPEADGSPTSTEENYFVLPPQQYRGDSPKAILTHSPRLEADNRPRPDPDVDAAEVGILDKRSLPINFPRRLFAILQDPDVADNIHWKEDGRTFVIRRTSEFAQHVLPMYYGHFSFRTFVKLLTMHDFRVIAKPYSIQDGEMFECSHPMFVRDHPSLLQAVRKSINKDTPAERTHESPRTRSGPPYWNYTAQR